MPYKQRTYDINLISLLQKALNSEFEGRPLFERQDLNNLSKQIVPSEKLEERLDDNLSDLCGKFETIARNILREELNIKKPEDLINQLIKLDPAATNTSKTSKEDAKKREKLKVLAPYALAYHFNSKVKSGGSIKAAPLFETPEHTELGNNLTLYLPTADENFDSLSGKTPQNVYQQSKESFSDQLKLSIGDIVALAGDYFGAAPIASLDPDEQEGTRQRFLNAYAALANTSPEKVDEIKKIISTDWLKNATLNSYGQEIALAVAIPGYFELLNNNTDHFVPWAEKAYQAGHEIALELAKKARDLGPQLKKHPEKLAEQKKLLIAAYQIDAFALHFLSDNFSAGHLRVGELRTEVPKEFGTLGSLLVNSMHNEDSANGLWCQLEGHEKPVLLKGDNHLNDPDNAQGKKVVQNAMQESFNNIFYTFRGHKPDPTRLPKVIATNNHLELKGLQQSAPLLKQDQNGKIVIRHPLDELNPGRVEYRLLGESNLIEATMFFRVEGGKAVYRPHTYEEANENISILKQELDINDSIGKDLKIAAKLTIDRVSFMTKPSDFDFAERIAKSTYDLALNPDATNLKNYRSLINEASQTPNWKGFAIGMMQVTFGIAIITASLITAFTMLPLAPAALVTAAYATKLVQKGVENVSRDKSFGFGAIGTKNGFFGRRLPKDVIEQMEDVAKKADPNPPKKSN